MRIIKDVDYIGSGHQRQMLDLYLPNTAAFDVLIYFHGGGLESGDKSEPMASLASLPQEGIAIASTNYRLYPHACYPDFVRDAAAAVAWVKNNIGQYGNCNRLFIGGSSAGAYISMLLGFDRQYLGAHAIAPEDISGYIFDAGQPTTHFRVLQERGMDPRRIVIDEAAPLYHLCENGHPFPILLTVAQNDIPGRYEQIQLLRCTWRQFGYPEERIVYRYMEGHSHCDYISDKAFAQMISMFIRSTNAG